MCFPIQYAVTWPERVSNTLPPLDFASLAKLDFEAPRWDDFPALNLAKEAGTVGGTLPAVLNAANEIAVSAFLEGHLSFPGIWDTVAETMSLHRTLHHPSLEEIVAKMAEYQLGRTISAEDTKAIVAFLGSLKGRVDENYIKQPELPADGPDTPKGDS
jgi:1-deoxy-D-xylulose 5-phosphate reductoisomerase